MTRMSKQGKGGNVSPRKPRPPGPKNRPEKRPLELGYKPHENAVAATALNRFIPKIG